MVSPVGLWIDWAGTGFGSTAYDDLTSYVTRVTTVGGATPEITGASQAGSATFVLKNPDGLFDPDNASSPLYGLLRDGPRVWWGANTDGTLVSGRTVRGRWAGRIVEIAPVPVGGAGTSTPTVEIVCEDPLSWYGRVPVKVGVDRSPANPTSETSFTFGTNDAGSTIVVLELVPPTGVTLAKVDANSIGSVAGIAFGGPIAATGMAVAGGIAIPSGSFGSAGDGWIAQTTGNANMFTSTTYQAGSVDLPDPTTLSPSNWYGGYLTTRPATIRQAQHGTVAAGKGVFLTFPLWSGSVPANHTEVALSLQPVIGSWLVAVQCWNGDYGDALAALPSGWVQDADSYGSGTFGGVDCAAECRVAHHVVGA